MTTPLSNWPWELKELLKSAAKMAGTKHIEELDDALILVALLKETRLFSEVDNLLKHLPTPIGPKQLLKAIGPVRIQPQQAERIQHYLSYPVRHQDPVLLSTFLIHLLQSPHPKIKQALAQLEFSHLDVEETLTQMQSGQLWLTIRYWVKEILELLFWVMLWVVIIKQGVFEFRLIPSESMVPTLLVEDRIVVEKPSYMFGQPDRGDVVVFYPPAPFSQLDNDPISLFLRLTHLSVLVYAKEDVRDRAFIKRLIAKPGDELLILPYRGLWLNGKRQTEHYINEIAGTCTALVQKTPAGFVFPHTQAPLAPLLPPDVKDPSLLMLPRGANMYDYCGPIKLPQHQYYMLGDNRNNSEDSRFWGPLSKDRIVGKASWRFWPLNRVGPINAKPYPVKYVLTVLALLAVLGLVGYSVSSHKNRIEI